MEYLLPNGIISHIPTYLRDKVSPVLSQKSKENKLSDEMKRMLNHVHGSNDYDLIVWVVGGEAFFWKCDDIQRQSLHCFHWQLFVFINSLWTAHSHWEHMSSIVEWLFFQTEGEEEEKKKVPDKWYIIVFSFTFFFLVFFYLFTATWVWCRQTLGGGLKP